MNVFIVGSPIETARSLDKRRLSKQIIECQQILDALGGKKAWSNHPCTLQYKGHERWLGNYMGCLLRYKCGEYGRAEVSSQWCDRQRPPFHTQEYFDQMKRRLYTKDPVHYNQWQDLGPSEENWYFVDGVWRKYVKGKWINKDETHK